MRKERSFLRCLKITVCVIISVFILILLLLYHRHVTYDEEDLTHHHLEPITRADESSPRTSTNRAASKSNLRKAHDHYVTGFDNSTRTFSYVVFTDPQIGLYDMMQGRNGGKSWKHDLKKLRELGNAVTSLDPKPDFIFCTGDLNNAFPLQEPGFEQAGFQHVLRPHQTKDLQLALGKFFPNDIPFLVIPGNHDLSEDTRREHLKLYTDTWGDPYFHFWNAERAFVALETQLFRSEEPETVSMRHLQIDWLKKLFTSISSKMPKTLFQHVPLFLQNANEPDSNDVVPTVHRKTLLRMFCENNVNIVFSGHTHFASLPKPYKCGDGRTVRQIVLTSISAQLRANGKPSYIVANVDANGKTSFKIQQL